MRTFLVVLSMASFAGCAEPSVLHHPVSPTPATVSDGAIPDELFMGHLTFAGGDGERSAIAKSVDAATEAMNFIARGIARNRLKETNRVPSRIELSRRRGQLTVVIDGRRYTGPLDGTPVTVTGLTGDEVEMTYGADGADLIQTFRGEDGGRENTFQLLDEQTVALGVRVFSQRLPADVFYSLTYHHGPSAGAAR